MKRPTRLDDEAIANWQRAHPAWSIDDGGGSLSRELRFADYPSTIGFVVRLALEAERRDHHPDLLVRWGRVRVTWSTHDAGGITELDLALAERTDALAAP